MQAWILNDTQGLSSYRLAEVPTPDPGPGEVRVRLLASALNRLDLWMSMGLPAPKYFPHVPGGDGAGIVDAVGEGVSVWEPGAEVIVNPGLGYAPTSGDIPFDGKLGVLGEHTWGTLAEYVVVPASNLVAKPFHLAWDKASAYGLSFGTAYRMLRRARLKTGDLMLVVGIGGGVSTAGMLIGLHMGAEVYVTSRHPHKIRRAVELGASGGFPSEGRFAEQLKQTAGRSAAVVFENVGPATWRQSMRALSPGGRVVTCGSTSGTKVEISVPPLFFRHLEIIGSTMFDHQDFAQVTQWVAEGVLPVLIDSTYRFDNLPQALSRMEAGDHQGKIVLEWSGI
ncbi:MAG: zinc-binding dehydrogenase [bacterium]|nr:zinc-binding dehydrogenase [bacterium]MCY3579090.1 zinc-binding dehydrogenase [bacterium]